MKRTVALKLAIADQLSSVLRVERFFREARAAANLLHPNIVPVFDSGREGLHHYIAAAFIEGQSLQEVLKGLGEGEVLPQSQAVAMVRKLAEALAYAHKSGVTHRDVKPGNVMLRNDGEPLLMDFGLARRADEERITMEGKFMGTPEFMAPEQWRGQAEAASDQYSLGCVLFELLTGQLPFVARDSGQYLVQHTTVPAPSPRKYRREVPADLETICLKCLEKEPARRYGDCQALADDLRRWQEGEPVLARRPGLVERLEKWGRRNPAVASLLGVVLLVLLTAVGVVSGFWRNAVVQATAAHNAEM